MKLYFVLDENGLQITKHAHKTVGGISVRSVSSFDISLNKDKKAQLKLLIAAIEEKELLHRHFLLTQVLHQVMNSFEEADVKHYVMRLWMLNMHSLHGVLFPKKTRYDFTNCSLPHRDSHYEDVYQEDDTLQMLGMKKATPNKPKTKVVETPAHGKQVEKVKKKVKQVKLGKSKKK